jgi:hypothetical protein
MAEEERKRCSRYDNDIQLGVAHVIPYCKHDFHREWFRYISPRVQQQPMTLLYGSFYKPVQAIEQVFSLLLTVIIHKISDAVVAYVLTHTPNISVGLWVDPYAKYLTWPAGQPTRQPRTPTHMPSRLLGRRLGRRLGTAMKTSQPIYHNL